MHIYTNDVIVQDTARTPFTLNRRKYAISTASNKAKTRNIASTPMVVLICYML